MFSMDTSLLDSSLDDKNDTFIGFEFISPSATGPDDLFLIDGYDRVCS